MADGVVQNVRICAGRRGRGRVRAGLSGRDGVSLAGVGELAAEPAVLVQAAAGTSIRPVCVIPADPYGGQTRRP